MGQGLLIPEVSRTHTTTHHSRWDERSACRRDLYLTAHNTHNRHTYMPSVGFEPTISAGQRPQTHALDYATTGTGKVYITEPNKRKFNKLWLVSKFIISLHWAAIVATRPRAPEKPRYATGADHGIQSSCGWNRRSLAVNPHEQRATSVLRWHTEGGRTEKRQMPDKCPMSLFGIQRFQKVSALNPHLLRHDGAAARHDIYHTDVRLAAPCLSDAKDQIRMN